jgi:hypothetical protein
MLQLVSWTALIATIVPAALFLAGRAMTLDQAKLIMLLATIAWFAVTPFWMGRPKTDEAR